MAYKVGFTGTQIGATGDQVMRVWARLHKRMIEHSLTEFHHGDCVGADQQLFEVATILGFTTVAHPWPDGPKRAHTDSDVILPWRDYMDRNEDIAFVCDELIATPKESTEQQRSGTWSTVRRARRFHKPITIVLPSGELVEEGW